MGAVLARDVHVTKDGVNFVVLHAGETVPKRFEKLVTNPKAFREVVEEDAGGQGGGGSSSDESTGYAGQSNDDLKAELKKRELPQTGNKAELVARLEKDDAEKASAEGESGNGGDSGDGDGSGDESDGGGTEEE
jgi:hypothetical protein